MPRRTIWIGFAAALLLPTLSFAQQSAPAPPSPAPSAPSDTVKPIDPQLKSDIQHLLVTMKGLDAAESGLRATFEQLRPELEASLPASPNRAKIIDAYEDKLVAMVRSPEFQDGIVAIYAQHFSDGDIKAINQFYESPSGQRFVRELPQVVSESAALGQQTATDNIPRILDELCKEFPELQGDAKFCPGDTSRKQSGMISPGTGPVTHPFKAIKNAEGN